MSNERPADNFEVLIANIWPVQRQVEHRSAEAREAGRAAGYSYEMKLGRETIRLNEIEFRILSLLAANPYQAFTRRQIVEAVSTESHPVTEATLGQHIATLREKLGFFGDYIQSVPFVGYRFKA
jgi:DNA-binding response OmpR family regulator